MPELMEDALEYPASWNERAEDDQSLRELAGLFAQANEIACKGAFVALRMDAASACGLYRVSMGGPLLGEAYFDEGGTDLVVLMRTAIQFFEDRVA